MIVDVLYEGLALAKGAEARSDGDALFVELESPMPVGTRLVIRTPEGERDARVEAVNEGLKSGVTVRFGAAAAAKAPAPVEESKNGESGGGDDDETPEPSDSKEPPDPKKTGRQRKKTRKTVMGH
jgi:hypothetical protein